MNLPLPLRFLLWPFSLAYGAGVWLKSWMYQHTWLEEKRLNATVISVGNLTVGGTGKTPMVIWLAQRLAAQGKRVAILSRGYHGNGQTSDEIELMRKRLGSSVSFGVGKNRYAEAVRLSSQSIDVFILDDGFQHLSLARDLDIVMIDASRPLQKERLLPAGSLREPRSALDRADLVVFTRTELLGPECRMENFAQIPSYSSTTSLIGFQLRSVEPDSGTVAHTLPAPIFAFCGIGNPEAFLKDLQRWGINVAGRRFFRDHHRYTRSDLCRIEEAAQAAGAAALITTEKDAQNIDPTLISGLPIYVALIELCLPAEQEFMRDLNQRLAKSRGAAA